MKTTILADLGLMALLFYLIYDDGKFEMLECTLFGIVVIVNIIKWITTPRKER